jgi:hypothetical protein
LPRLQTHEQKRKLRTSEAGCGESRTPRFNREVPRIIPGIDSTKAEVSEIESDLVKVTNSEVGLRGIKVFKKLDEAAAQLRQEIASVQEWMSADTGDWVCPIDLAPLVWNQLINIRDNIAPGLRNQLKADYEAGLEDYQERIDQFLSLNTWELAQGKQESVKANLLRAFPTLTDLEDYLQVVIGRPVIIPALSEHLIFRKLTSYNICLYLIDYLSDVEIQGWHHD